MQTKTIKQKRMAKNQRIQMKIWTCAIDTFSYSEYQLINAKDREFFDKLCIPEIIKGKPLKDLWKPLIFMKKRQRKNTDFSIVGDAGIVMSQKAIEALTPLMQHSAEVLPLKTMVREPFFFVNVLESLDALDEEKTVFQYSSVSKTKIGIEKFVFDPQKVLGKHIFKIKGFWFNTFISDEFRQVCKKNNLEGIDFKRDKLLWKDTYTVKTNNSQAEQEDDIWGNI